MGVVGELFQNIPYLFMSFKNPVFKKLKNVNAEKLIHMGAKATLKIFEIFPRLVREFDSHSVSLIIGILQSLISNAFAHASMPLKA
ncbi:hypothetical protein [Helicobacter pylori]|uniref:hypothetical protein n=1 Tax=Helicobacter pylori TaxID=210 RepID=UPI002064D2EE|nr:hypothetical protein [Helicobacter pylori]BCI99418.1 hypothetical protein JSHR3_04110 [Helicobacter pylori]